MEFSKKGKNLIVSCYSKQDEQDYRKFLLNQDSSNFFHRLEWKEILEGYYNFKPYYLIAKDEQNQIKAILPLFYVKNLFGKRLESLPLSIYGGAVGKAEYIKYLIKEAFYLKKKLSCRYLIIKQHTHLYDNIYQKNDMKKLRNKWTQIINIIDPEILWEEIYKSNRNAIRKAQKNNLKIEKINNIEKIDDFFELEIQTYKKIGLHAFSKDFFKTLWGRLHSKGLMEIFIVKYKETPVASCLCYIHENKVIFAHANSDKKFLHLRPNNFLLWQVIKWCHKNNYSILDLGATDDDNQGLFFFKSSFNSVNIPFAHYYNPKDTVLFEKTIVGKVSKRCIKKTPVFLLKFVYPFIVKKLG